MIKNICVLSLFCIAIGIAGPSISTTQAHNHCLTIELQESYGKYIYQDEFAGRDLPCDHTPVGPPETVDVGTQWDWYIWSLNGYPEAELKSCTVRGGSEHAWVVVEDSQWNVNVTQAQVDAVLQAFEDSSVGQFPDQGIWDLNTGHFGFPPDHLDQDGKVYIVYYDFDVSSDGFFWSFDQGCDGSGSFASNECDALYMNCSDHAPDSDYMIAVLAHEFEHLIHYEQDANEASWVDEGLAELAMWLYGFPDNISMFNTNPDNSLNTWNGNWSDYIKTYLWTLYFYEQFGGQTSVYDFVQEPANGINGYTNFFINHGYSRPFADYFSSWTLANYLDDTSLETGQYGYDGDTLPPFKTIAQHDTYPVTNSTTVNYWATDYIQFTSLQPLVIDFDGDDTNSFSVWTVETDPVNPTRITQIPLDTLQKGEITLNDLGTDYSNVILVVASVSDTGGKQYTYNANEAASTTPTPTATPVWYGDDPEMRFLLNGQLFEGGDDFILDAQYWNSEPEPLTVDIFIVLDVYGNYWFWPSWISLSEGIDFRTEDLPSTAVATENILTFVWPSGSGSAEGLCFLGAMLDHESSQIFGNLQQTCFDYDN